MIAFLDCMNQLIEYAQKADKTLKLPYAYAAVPSVVMGQKSADMAHSEHSPQRVHRVDRFLMQD